MTAYIKLATREFPLHQGDIRLEHPEIGEEFICLILMRLLNGRNHQNMTLSL